MSWPAKPTSGLALQPLYQQVIEFGARLIDCTSAYVSEIDLERHTTTVVAEFIGRQASEAEQISDIGTHYNLEEEFGTTLDSVMKEIEPYLIHVDDDDLPPAERDHMETYGAKSILGFPLLIDGMPVAGVEFWESRRRREFTAEEIELVRATVQQVAIPIENARLYAQAMSEIQEREELERQIGASHERRGRQVQLSTQVTKDIAAATDLSDLYQRVVTQVKEQFGFYHVQLLRYEPAVDAVILIAGYGETGQKMLNARHRMPMGVGLIGRAADAGRSVLRPDVSQDLEWQPNPLLPHTWGELAVPIVLGEEVLGVLDVQSDTPNALDEDDQLALEGLCGQIAIAIESTRLRQEMEDRLRELDQLQRIMSRQGWQTFRTQRELATKGYRFDQSSVQPVAPNQLQAGTAGPPVTGPDNLIGPQKVVISPMKVRGEVIGSLGIQDDPEHPLAAEDRELLDSISVQVAEALESARLLEQTNKHAIELEAVARVSAAASTILDTDKLLQTVVTLAKERFDLYHVAIFTLDENLLHLAADTSSPAGPEDEEPLLLDFSQSEALVARTARTRQPVLANDITQETAYPLQPTQTETRSELSIPLIVGDDMLGVLDLQSEIPRRFSEDDIRIHITLAAQVAVALQNANLYAEQLRTAARLREVDRLKSEFLASMSHELRTPLNSIIGFADVLLEGIDGSLNERMQEDVTLIRDSGRHLRQLISEMLDMSKIEAGVMELHYEQINVSLLAREIMANAKSLAMHKDLDIHLKVHPNLVHVEADRTRLTQVLLNLMSNAIKFTEEGAVTLSMEEEDGHLVASVQDTGIGIKEDDIPAIFEQFRQIDGSLTRKVGGTGLGIPISKKLVELHGGDMWVESEPGVGSTFWFTIPGQLSTKQKLKTGPLQRSKVEAVLTIKMNECAAGTLNSRY